MTDLAGIVVCLLLGAHVVRTVLQAAEAKMEYEMWLMRLETTEWLSA